MSEVTGKVSFLHKGETFETWYKVVGDLTSGVRPLVTLHGGPGIAHHYMLPHTALYKSHGIPVVLYDQVGIGESSHLRGKPTEFFTMDLFMDELDNLLKHLGISNDYDVVGHSWGGMLALSHITQRRPAGLKRLILVGTPSSMELWQIGTRQLLEGLPEDIRETIKKCEQEGKTDSPDYKRGMEVFYLKHICKVQPRPEELKLAKAAQVADPTVYSIMCGPSEFYITGTIKTWTVIDQLVSITQPTLIINGADDEATDLCVSPLFQKIPKAKWVQLANSSHMGFFEEKERYLQIVSDFLTL